MKLYTIGCSHTHYVWPTYSDILSQEYDEYQNWGSSGIGNYAIMHRVIEMSELYKSGDTFIIQWTYPTRFDFHMPEQGWYQGGNLANDFDTVQNVINRFAFDPDSYEWQTQNFIELTRSYLTSKNIRFRFIAPDFDTGDTLPQLNIMDTFDIPKRRFINVRPDSALAAEDHHWTPKHHLKYLESAGFTITEKMLNYIDKAETLLDEITNWKQINRNMRIKGLLQHHVYGR